MTPLCLSLSWFLSNNGTANPCWHLCIICSCCLLYLAWVHCRQTDSQPQCQLCGTHPSPRHLTLTFFFNTFYSCPLLWARMTQMPHQQPLLLQLHMAVAGYLQATTSKLGLIPGDFFFKNMHRAVSGSISFYIRLQKCAAEELQPAKFVLNCLINMYLKTFWSVCQR